ncbi:uncharacterized protein LOC128956803 [Oppia nitens]|uniref:uncharacterized protein LOC128956803 n=1 Tax=Oppia nitens TaxID=1686743 RepID=UPI0023DA54EF|nr:uncharacterized protein LOC128956803 [Oppia nitens]
MTTNTTPDLDRHRQTIQSLTAIRTAIAASNDQSNTLTDEQLRQWLHEIHGLQLGIDSGSRRRWEGQHVYRECQQLIRSIRLMLIYRQMTAEGDPDVQRLTKSMAANRRARPRQRTLSYGTSSLSSQQPATAPLVQHRRTSAGQLHQRLKSVTPASQRRPPLERSTSAHNIRVAVLTERERQRTSIYETPSGSGGRVGSGWSPNLLMSGLYGHLPQLTTDHLKGELFMSASDRQLTDRDYELLSHELINYGLIIDQQNQLDKGTMGIVFTGRYGQNISKLMDIEGQYIQGCQPGQQFAAKLIKFDTTDSKRKRRCLYMEKQIMKLIARSAHVNVVCYRMAVNMGRSIQCQIPTVHQQLEWFLSYERTVIIMDLADHQSLYDYRLKASDETTGSTSSSSSGGGLGQVVFDARVCVKFLRDMLAGLRYLHRLGVTHGDIHDGNILLFSHSLANPSRDPSVPLVAKWTDFGGSKVRRIDGRQYLTDTEHRDYVEKDMLCMQYLVRDDMLNQVDPRMDQPRLDVWRQLADQLSETIDIQVLYIDYLVVIESIGL